jgi:hypothetical protein
MSMLAANSLTLVARSTFANAGCSSGCATMLPPPLVVAL